MQLKELLQYDEITIQAHDNPDADAIASGYALYLYFKSKGKKTSLIYSGRYEIQKNNLKLMINHLDIPIEYRDPNKSNKFLKGLLITVDCQYSAGNVQYFYADAVAVIDHHQKEINTSKLVCWEIDSNLGSCSTLVWKLLMEDKYSNINDAKLGTALYYGLYRDTYQFSEISYPLDMDMRESVVYDKSIIQILRNSNLSLQELEIAGIALIRSTYNNEHHYSIIRAEKCDPNLLGLISDFLIQVDEITTAIVFSELDEGYKFSVRSCVKEVQANELAKYIAQNIGSGGGHYEKAGGFIKYTKYSNLYGSTKPQDYFESRINEYFESYDIIDASSFVLCPESMGMYYKRDNRMGYALQSDYFEIGTDVNLRTIDGDMEFCITDNQYIICDELGRIKLADDKLMEKKFVTSKRKCDIHMEYMPRIRNVVTGESKGVVELMRACAYKKELKVYAKELSRGIKLFTSNNELEYMVGKPGDFLVVNVDDTSKMVVVERNRFIKNYELLG